VARRARTRLASLTALVLTASCTIGVASGQEGAAAARSFQAGAQAYARSDFRAAAAAFDDAYRLAPRGAAAYNAGLSWERAGEAPRAAQDYSKALVSSDLGAAERADATGRLKGLEGHVGRLRVVAPDDAQVSVDDSDVTEVATHLYVAPGRHALRVQLGNGRTESRSVSVGPGETVEARFASPELDVRPARPEAPPAADPLKTPASAGPDRTMVFVTLGGAALMSIAAIVSYEHGLSERNAFVQGNYTSGSLRDQAETFRALTWVSWGLAGVLAGTGAILWFTAPSSSTPTALRVGPMSMALDARF
jgi:hypothetical protein